MDEHSDAVEYDLMTRVGATLDDVPARIPWRALSAFVRKLDPQSATFAELNPELAAWVMPTQVQKMIADVYDRLGDLWNVCALGATRRRQRPATPYPRPGKGKGKKVFGSGAIPIGEFDAWWEEGANV